jgi:hypothetical protein
MTDAPENETSDAQSRAATAAYTMEALDEIRAKLAALPPKDPKQRKLDRQAGVKYMLRELTSLQERGYTLEEIVESVNGFGFQITTPTLKTYLQRARSDNADRPKAKRAAPSRRAKTDAAKAASVTARVHAGAIGGPGPEPAAKRAVTVVERAETAVPAAASAPGTPSPPAADGDEKSPPFRSGKGAFLLKDKVTY